MKIALIAAALLLPLPAAAQTWFVDDIHDNTCPSLEEIFGPNLHSPVDVFDELVTENADPSFKNFPALPDGTQSVQINLFSKDGEPEAIELFTNHRICMGYLDYLKTGKTS